MQKFAALTIFFSISLLLYNTGCQLTSLADEAHTVDKIEKTYSVESGGHLTIESEQGAIEVQTAEQNQVEIVVTKTTKSLRGSANEVLADFDVSFERSDTGVHIEGKFKQGREHWKKKLDRLEIRFQVTVPKNYNVDLKTQSGSITIGDLDGTIRVKTHAGSMRFGNITGTIWGRSSAGSINLVSCDSPVDLETSAGSIKLENVSGSVNAKTSAGSIRAYVTTQLQNESSLRTSAGSIVVTLVPDIAIDVDAETSAGSVSTDFAVSSTIQKQKWGPKNTLKGTINDGGPLLKLRTSAGSIRLRKATN